MQTRLKTDTNFEEPRNRKVAVWARVLWWAFLSVGVFVFVWIVPLLETEENVHLQHPARNESETMSTPTITCVSVYIYGFNFLPAVGGLRQPVLFLSTLLDMRRAVSPPHLSSTLSFPTLLKSGGLLLSKNAEHTIKQGAESCSIVATKWHQVKNHRNSPFSILILSMYESLAAAKDQPAHSNRLRETSATYRVFLDFRA